MAGAFALLLILPLAFVKLGEPDLWWHIASGRLILQQGIPGVNTFSHAWPEHPWPQTQWLFDVLLGICERVGGLGGVQLFQVVLVLLTFGLVWLAQRRRSAAVPWWMGLALLVMVVSASRFRFAPRPHLITYLGMAFLVYFSSRTPRPGWRHLAGLGGLALFWANCHSGVVFGAGYLCLLNVGLLLDGRRDEAKSWLFPFLAFVLGSLVNFGGNNPYGYTLFHANVNDIIVIEEFKPSSLYVDLTFFLLGVLFLSALLAGVRRSGFRNLLPAGIFLGAAVVYLRLIPLGLLIAFPPAVAVLGEWLGWTRVRQPRAVPVILVALVLLAGGLVTRDLRLNASAAPFGWGENIDWLPETAARFVEQRQLTGEMFNDFDFGGYLIWRFFPARKVFVDGRIPAYPEHFFHEIQGALNPGDWPRLMRAYGVDYAVVQRRYEGLGALFEDIGWRLVHLDGTAYVYVRPGSENDILTRADRFYLLAATDTAGTLQEKATRWPQRVSEELSRVHLSGLFSAAEMASFAQAALTAGNRELAERFWAFGLKLEPDNVALQGLRHSLAGSGTK